MASYRKSSGSSIRAARDTRRAPAKVTTAATRATKRAHLATSAIKQKRAG
jgi:hypothetical protein